MHIKKKDKKKSCYTEVTKKLHFLGYYFLEVKIRKNIFVWGLSRLHVHIKIKRRLEYFKIYSFYAIVVVITVIHCLFTIVLLDVVKNDVTNSNLVFCTLAVRKNIKIISEE